MLGITSNGETQENSQEAVGHTQEGTPFQPGAYLPVGGAPGLEQSREPPTAQCRLDVIVEETTEMTVMTAEEAESEATPLGARLVTLPHP